MYMLDPAMAAMYGIPQYIPDPEPTDIENAVRYCLPCNTSEVCKASDPCFFCGGEMTREKPTYWPPRQCSQTVNGSTEET